MSGAATHGGVDSCWFGGPAAPRPSSGNNPCWGPAAPPALSPIRSDWPHWTHGTRSPGPRAVSALPPAMETGWRPRPQTLRELWGPLVGEAVVGCGGEPEAGQAATGEAASREQSEPRREVDQAPGDLVQPHWTSKHRVRTRPLWPQPASVGRPSTEAQRTQPLGMTRGHVRASGQATGALRSQSEPPFPVFAPERVTEQRAVTPPSGTMGLFRRCAVLARLAAAARCVGPAPPAVPAAPRLLGGVWARL